VRQRLLELADARLQATVVVAYSRELGHARAAAAIGDDPTATWSRLELVVLLDEARELDLDDVEEGVDLLLVVPAFANRRFLEGHVVDFGGCEWHAGHLVI
jgi:hypothetical protein